MLGLTSPCPFYGPCFGAISISLGLVNTFRDGLAALVISPTRELSLQIFEVLRAFGKHHQLSAGLITGGKKEFREEQASVVRVNILIATPGRLLQHLEQTPGFDPSMLQVNRKLHSQ